MAKMEADYNLKTSGERFRILCLYLAKIIETYYGLLSLRKFTDISLLIFQEHFVCWRHLISISAKFWRNARKREVYRRHYDIIHSQSSFYCITLKALLNKFKIYLKSFIVAETTFYTLQLCHIWHPLIFLKEKCILPDTERPLTTETETNWN